MKSLLDFVVCCRGNNTNNSVPLASEDERSLVVVATSAQVRRPVIERKRRDSRHGGEWRPSLSAILEDSFYPEINRVRSSSAGSEKILIRRKCSSSDATASDAGSRSRPRNGGDFRRYDHPVVVPAFAPTFWF